LELELVFPASVIGIGKRRNSALPGIVDQYGGGTQFVLHRLGEMRNLTWLQHITGTGQNASAGKGLRQLGSDLVQSLPVTSAKSDISPRFQQQFDSGQAYAR